MGLIYVDACVLIDALHLACARHHGCEALWTNDDRLAQAGHGLARTVLKQPP